MGIYILNFLLNFHCVIVHQKIDIGIKYFLEKVLIFDIFCRDKKSWLPFEYYPCIGFNLPTDALSVWKEKTTLQRSYVRASQTIQVMWYNSLVVASDDLSLLISHWVHQKILISVFTLLGFYVDDWQGVINYGTKSASVIEETEYGGNKFQNISSNTYENYRFNNTDNKFQNTSLNTYENDCFNNTDNNFGKMGNIFGKEIRWQKRRGFNKLWSDSGDLEKFKKMLYPGERHHFPNFPTEL